jgi:hypothetical protein
LIGSKGESYAEDGVSHWVDLPHKVGSWLIEQNAVAALSVFLRAVALFSNLFVIEIIVTSPSLSSAIAGAIALFVALKHFAPKGFAKKI